MYIKLLTYDPWFTCKRNRVYAINNNNIIFTNYYQLRKTPKNLIKNLFVLENKCK